jgi:hypothetical protein
MVKSTICCYLYLGCQAFSEVIGHTNFDYITGSTTFDSINTSTTFDDITGTSNSMMSLGSKTFYDVTDAPF